MQKRHRRWAIILPSPLSCWSRGVYAILNLGMNPDKTAVLAVSDSLLVVGTIMFLFTSLYGYRKGKAHADTGQHVRVLHGVAGVLHRGHHLGME